MENPVEIRNAVNRLLMELEVNIGSVTGIEATIKLIEGYQFSTLLDVGPGPGVHASVFESFGKKVTTIDYSPVSATLIDNVDRFRPDIIGDYMLTALPSRYDVIWCCHVLEHQRNPGLFLEKLFADIKEGGILAITVPPAKHQIVGGHVTLWNAGLLLYNLVLSGFDCRNAIVRKYGYNISVIVKKVAAQLPLLKSGRGDIECLREFFPIPVRQDFYGDMDNIGWD